MSKSMVTRLVGVGFAVAAGLIVQFLVRQPLLAIASFVAVLLIVAIVFSRGLPVRISLDRAHRVLFGATGYYRDQETARPDIVATVHSSKRVDIMLIQGHTFILDRQSLLEEMLVGTQNLEVRILLLDPNGASMTAYLTSLGLSPGAQAQYRAKCALVENCLNGYQGRFALQYKYYDHFPSWKLIIADSHAFIAPYDAQRRGSRLPYVAYADMGRPFFVAFSNHFEQVWRRFSTAA